MLAAERTRLEPWHRVVRIDPTREGPGDANGNAADAVIPVADSVFIFQPLRRP
jgi:hypothetical protein